MKRVEHTLDAKQILSVIEKYSLFLDMLDDYDHQAMKKPIETKSTYILDYDEYRALIDSMKFGDNSSVFGNEKDESFKSSFSALQRVLLLVFCRKIIVDKYFQIC